MNLSVNHASLRDAVVDALRTAIFAGALQPGDPIKERPLAAHLGVSQATVREALLHLEGGGLVIRMKNRGTLVTNLSRREAEERIAVRKNLEVWAMMEAAARMSPAQFSELDERLGTLARATAENSYLSMTNCDLEFHRYIWRCSGNAILCETLERVCAPLFAFISFLNKESSEIKRLVVDEHTRLFDALQNGNAERIREAISRHIDLGYESGRKAHLTYGYQ